MPPFEPQKKSSSPLYVVVVVVVLIIIALMVYGYNSQNILSQSSNNSNTTSAPKTKAKENVTVQSTNLSSGKESKVPAGFPSFITIDPSAVFTQSYTAAFPDRKVTQYTVVFSTKASLATNVDTYKTMLKTNGFTPTSGIDTTATQSFYGKKNNNDISITVSKDPAGSTVAISYLSRE